MLLFLIAGLLLSSSAIAGEYSVACKKVYRSDVVRGTAYQNFCLTGKKPKTVLPVPLKCSERTFSPLEFKRRLPLIRELVKRSDWVEIEVPRNLRLLVSYYFKKAKKVIITPRPEGTGIKLKLCERRR